MYNQTDNAGKTWLGVGLAVLLGAALALIFVFRAQRPEAIPAPQTFTTYTAMDNSFTCDEPGGWDTESGAAGGINSGALFQRSGAKIDIDTDLAGSLQGDMTRVFNAQMGDSMPGVQLKSPVEVLHERGESAMKEKLSDYQEQPYTKLSTDLGEGCCSEFTGNGGLLVGKVHGYRVTMLSSERRVKIVCQCPESSWKTLQPAFMRVITSFKASRS